MRRHSLAAVIAFIVSILAGTGAAQAIVLDANPDPSVQSQASIQYPNDESNYIGVDLLPGTYASGRLQAAKVPNVTTTGNTCDNGTLTVSPETADIFLPTTGICYHSPTIPSTNAVIHKNETFTLVWGPNPYRDWTVVQPRAVPARYRRWQRLTRQPVRADPAVQRRRRARRVRLALRWRL